MAAIIDLSNIKFEDFEREKLDEIYNIIAPYSEMEKNERYFLNGIIKIHQARENFRGRSRSRGRKCFNSQCDKGFRLAINFS